MKKWKKEFSKGDFTKKIKLLVKISAVYLKNWWFPSPLSIFVFPIWYPLFVAWIFLSVRANLFFNSNIADPVWAWNGLFLIDWWSFGCLSRVCQGSVKVALGILWRFVGGSIWEPLLVRWENNMSWTTQTFQFTYFPYSERFIYDCRHS